MTPIVFRKRGGRDMLTLLQIQPELKVVLEFALMLGEIPFRLELHSRH